LAVVRGGSILELVCLKGKEDGLGL